jgi:hypothetical protein
MNDYSFNRFTELACAFPPSLGLRGAMTSILDLTWCAGLRNRVFCPTKADAARLVMKAAMRRSDSQGRGNRARRRIQNLSTQFMRVSEPGPVSSDTTGTSVRARTHVRG